jgi:hypothetical protein
MMADYLLNAESRRLLIAGATCRQMDRAALPIVPLRIYRRSTAGLYESACQGFGQRRRQWRQTMGCACGVAGRAVFTVFPRGVELAASARTLGVHRAADPSLAYLTDQGNAARRLGLGAQHGHTVVGDLGDQFVGNRATCRLALAPIEGHTEVRAAGAALKARIGFGHVGSEGG